MPRTRYHPYIASAAYGQFVAANSGGTFSGETDCDSSLVLSYAIDPKGRRAPWLDELLAPPPSPPPSAPSPPPPSPPSAPPSAPPASPFVYSGAEGHASLLAEVRVAHEAACTSVYWQTSADRCDALAVALTQRVRYVAVSPPSPPPAAPDVLAPPPPSAPPSPPLPAGVTEVAVAGVVLSTLRDPYTFDEARGGVDDVVGDGYAWPPGYVVDRAAWAALPFGARAACLASAAADAVPCVSAVLEANCLDAARKCGTQAANGERPTLELTLATEPRQRRAYLWGLELVLPDTPELAGLLFASIDTGGGRGYRAIVYAGDGSVLNTPSFEPSAAAPDDRRVLVTFAGVGDDAQVLALKDAKYVELVLPGAQRQIWLKRITVYERSLAEAGLLAPQPPEPPAPPPLPGPTRRRRRPSRRRRRRRRSTAAPPTFCPTRCSPTRRFTAPSPRAAASRASSAANAWARATSARCSPATFSTTASPTAAAARRLSPRAPPPSRRRARCKTTRRTNRGWGG